VWAYDFVHDACANGQKIKCLTIIDEFTRECLAIDVAGSIRSARVIDVLTRLISEHGAPAFLRSDNGLNASLLSSKSDSHPRRLAGAFDAMKQSIRRQPVVFRGRGEPCLTIVDTRFNALSRDLHRT
jgi:Integrase core domain